MNKILSFIVNNDKKLLLLKGSANDPQFKESFLYFNKSLMYIDSSNSIYQLKKC